MRFGISSAHFHVFALSQPAILAGALLLPAIVTIAFLWLVVRGVIPAPLDRPTARSMHINPTPRIGGVAVALGLLAALAWLRELPGWVGPWLLVLFVSLAEDFRGASVAARLLCHLVAAIWLVVAVAGASNPWLRPLLVVLVLWMINLYNFMDGADGIAGGMAAVGFFCIGLAASWASDLTLSSVALGVCGAAIAFLAFNFPPARVFLGDAGSIPLGLLAAALGLTGIAHGYWDGWFVVLAFLPFIADATLTLLRRALRGEKVWIAHKEHFYQRLVRSGWEQRRSTLLHYALMAGCGGTALVLLHQAERFMPAAVLTWLVVLMAFYSWVEIRFQRSIGVAHG